jgi:CRP-like cAMP-binding protein
MATDFKTYLTENTGLSLEQLDQLSGHFNVKSVEKGQVLLNMGDICQHSFFVEKGLLRAYTIDDIGKEHIVQFAAENWFISDRSSLFFHEPAEYYIDAIENSRVVFIDSQFNQKAASLNPAFSPLNERLLQNHIRYLQKRINLLISASAEIRYLDFIKLYPDLLLRVPQWMVASYLGITPESLSRVRKNLAQQHFKRS